MHSDSNFESIRAGSIVSVRTPDECASVVIHKQALVPMVTLVAGENGCDYLQSLTNGPGLVILLPHLEPAMTEVRMVQIVRRTSRGAVGRVIS